MRTPEAWRDDAIERVIGTVQSFDPRERTVRLADGTQYAYEALLLATGGHARRLSIPGADLDGVFAPRTLDDAAAIAPRFVAGARVVLIGGGFIGLEAAASARLCGCEVNVLESAPRLLGRCVPQAIALRVQVLHERQGVQVHLNVSPVSIGRRARGELAVTLADERVWLADTVIVGIGIDPADELARAAGLDVARGVKVDATLKSSAHGVYAAGDVALFPSRFTGQPIRQETWHNAESQARVAAHNMLGAREPYRELPWFWSDQYDHQIQVAGEPALGAQTVTRALAADAQIHFHLDAHGDLVGASGFGLASGFAKDMKLARMLVDGNARAAPAVLADPLVKLKSLL